MTEAAEPLSQALRRANALQDVGNLHEAEQLYKYVLRTEPDHFEALHMLGLIEHQRGHHAEAVRLLGHAVAIKPDSCEAHYNHGYILAVLNQYQEALESYDHALAIEPAYPSALYNRGNVLAALNRPQDALTSYDRALTANPHYAEAHNNRGNILCTLNRPAEALASFDRAVSINPMHVPALYNRGNILIALNQPEEALRDFDQAIAVQPDFAEAHNNRGNVLAMLNHQQAALASFDRAIAIRPNYADALYNRSVALQKMNRWQESIENSKRTLAIKPDHPEARFALCMSELPILYLDEKEIRERRAAYRRRLLEFCDHINASGHLDYLAKGVGSNQPFYLAYQGYNDRDLQTVYGSLVCRIMARHYPTAVLTLPPTTAEPVRVGIVSGFFCDHTVWKMFIKGWTTQLDRRRFRIFGYHTGLKSDDQTKAALAACDRFVQGPRSADQWRETILADAPHVLIYPEIGMDATSAKLAAQRLAPVQCSSWGHPETSGLPTIDYFLSSDLMEPPNAQSHYSEKLVRLPNLSVYYEPLGVPPVSINRSELGLRSAATVYWCGQSLFKYLPQFDQIFPRIAREIPDSQFAFIQHTTPQITEIYCKRLERAFKAHGLDSREHCVFLPGLDLSRFVAVFGQCEAGLDSIGWSGGNTTLESLAHDLPIVTMPGPLMRGRHTCAILNIANVTETVVQTIDDYISVAVRLARDLPWRMAVKKQIAVGKHRVYRDALPILALEEFLESVARRKNTTT
jgi:protein O-GlcNAc transferase